MISGVLSKLGDTFDRITGRHWNPSSSLATSKLEEKLKFLLDSEAREVGNARFVPHKFKLKIQWNKFSTDSDSDLKKLEYELHAAAIDHINDRRYHTYAPIEVSVEKDYFVEGVKFIAGFGKYAEDDTDGVAVDVTLANIPVGDTVPEPEDAADEPEEDLPGPEICFEYSVSGKSFRKCLSFGETRRFSVGRTGTNDIVIDDPSVSKSHAAIALNKSGQVVIADTGSTNGTFISNVRMAYGKAKTLSDGTVVKFGDVEAAVSLKVTSEAPLETELFSASENEPAADAVSPQPTVASLDSGDVSPGQMKTPEERDI